MRKQKERSVQNRECTQMQRGKRDAHANIYEQSAGMVVYRGKKSKRKRNAERMQKGQQTERDERQSTQDAGKSLDEREYESAERVRRDALFRMNERKTYF